MENSPKVPQGNQAIRILLIEDNESLTELMEEIFRIEGYHSKCVPDIDNIFALLDEYMPKLVMLDYLLPNVNGGELCCQIKHHPDYCKIPVIIYSAFSKELISVDDYGYDAFIEKPFDLNELLKIIDNLLKRTN